ncbi:MAG TPA: CBS domain-containing protein [Candidatus Limnocylindrales bacterium]
MNGTLDRDHHGPIVADHMAASPILVRADASLSEAVALMDRHHVHGLPVIDDEGALIGVLSQTDLNRARSTEYLWANWPGLAVRHLMTSPAITVHKSTPLLVAARRMEEEHIHRLVVVEDGDDGWPIGVLSMTDLIHALAGETAASASRPSYRPESAE